MFYLTLSDHITKKYINITLHYDNSSAFIVHLNLWEMWGFWTGNRCVSYRKGVSNYIQDVTSFIILEIHLYIIIKK